MAKKSVILSEERLKELEKIECEIKKLKAKKKAREKELIEEQELEDNRKNAEIGEKIASIYGGEITEDEMKKVIELIKKNKENQSTLL